MRKLARSVDLMWIIPVLLGIPLWAENASGSDLSGAPGDQVPPTAVTAAVPEQAATPAQAPAPAGTPASVASKNGLAFGGNLFLALQQWSNIGSGVGQSGDSKIGVGLGGTFGIGFNLDSLKVIAGPSLWSNTWSTSAVDSKTNVTSTVHLTMNDAGVSVMSFFDDMFLELGTGNSTVSAGVSVGSQETSATYDKQSFSYKTFSIGMKTGIWMFGLGIKNYDGYASNANHANFMLGIGF